MIKRLALGRMIDRFAAATRASYDIDRRQHPERFVNAPDGLGSNFLFVENVARMLGCNVDHVRRIPRDALPASKVGARLIYARADVEAYISRQRDHGAGRYIAAQAPRTVSAKAPTEKLQPVATVFDPVAAVRKVLRAPS